MKNKLLFLLFSLVTVSPIEGQNVYTDYHPLVENGKKWTYKVSNPDSSPGYFEEWNDIYYLDGDTIVGSVPCLQLFVTSNRSASSPIRNYLGAIYENQGKVYFFISGSRTPELLYDFSSVESQTVKIGNTQLLFNKIMLIPYGTTFLKVFDWSPLEMNTFHGMWVEGIGSTIDLMNETPIWYDGCLNKELVSCECSGEELFNYATFETSLQQMSYYHPFIEEGKQWLTGRFPLGMPQADPFELSTFTFEGDTLVAEKKCKRWVKRTQHFSNSGGYVTTDFVLPLYEEDRQISFFYPDETEPRILYNFNPSNYTFMVYDPLRRYTEGLQCQRTDISYMASIPFRCHLFTTTEYHVNPNSERREEYGETDWFEGLGSMVGPDYNYRMDIDGGTGVLLKCVVGETILYENSIWQEKTDIHDIQIRNSKSIHHSCYDLSGRRVSASSVLPRGVYIRDGKKFVVR